MINHLQNSFDRAEKGLSKLDDYILNMEGMSGIKTRHFYNNIVNFEDCRYLEVGVWKGSSFCSTLCNNSIKATCIDNWSQFGNVKEEFHKNLEKYKGNNEITIIEEDCFKVDISKLGKFNVYMYDGDHTYDSHYASLLKFYNCLDDEFIFIVDDWNWEQVRSAIDDVITDLGLDIIDNREILTELEGKTSTNPQWWNGIGIFILKKL